MKPTVDVLYLSEKRKEVRSRIREELMSTGEWILRAARDDEEVLELHRLIGRALLSEVFDCDSTEFPTLKFILNSRVTDDLEREILREAREKLEELYRLVAESIEKGRGSNDGAQ